jgi:AcrR family transcriptional regulator
VAAVREELRRTGTFTVNAVAEGAGCSPATYYAHFPSKDEALTEAFGALLADLQDFMAGVFEVEALRRLGLVGFARALVADLVGYFRVETLAVRAGMAAVPENHEALVAYKTAEEAIVKLVAGFLTKAEGDGLLPGPDAAGRAAAVVVIVQGLNNPLVLRASPDEPIHEGLVAAMAAVLAGHFADSRPVTSRTGVPRRSGAAGRPSPRTRR